MNHTYCSRCSITHADRCDNDEDCDKGFECVYHPRQAFGFPGKS